MGTTLTGTTPQDTYDSLIKVTDNAPLTGSLKVLTDGLGNDSALALSTAAASVTGTLAVSGNATFDTSTLVVDAANNRVGVGVATPNQSFEVASIAQFNGSGLDGNLAEAVLFANSTFSTVQKNRIRSSISAAANGNLLVLEAGTATVGTYNNNQLVLRGDGNVGIGTSSPDKKLQVSGPVGVASTTSVLTSSNTGLYCGTGGSTSNYNGLFFQGVSSKDMYFGRVGQGGVDDLIVSTAEASPVEIVRFRRDGGLTFNGDTAAANALDDYEEGTWTPTISFGNASVGVVYNVATSGRYTKIGRQVSVTAYILLTSKGSSTGASRIGGLPFTIANSSGFYAAGSLAALDSITYGGQIQTYADINTTNFVLNDISEAGAQGNITNDDFTNATQIIFSATYFV